MNKENFSAYDLDHDGKKLKTFEEFKNWYLNKLKELKTEDKDFDELPFLLAEKKYINYILEDFVPHDNKSEIFKNNLVRYSASFLNLRLLPLQEKPESADDQFKSLVIWFDKGMSDLKDDTLQKQFIEKEIHKTEMIILHKASLSNDLKDEYFKEEFEAGQKYLAYLKDKRMDFTGLRETVINPVHDFKLLKTHRHRFFDKRKAKYILEREEKNLTSTEDDIKQCYIFWLEDEVKVIETWLGDNYPNGNKKRRHSDSDKTEILKYKTFVLNKIKELKNNEDLNSKVNMEKQEVYLVDELENLLITEGVRYKHLIDEDWGVPKFDSEYIGKYISGALLTAFIQIIYERIQPLNSHEANRYLTLSVAQFKSHTPENRKKEFTSKFKDVYWFQNVIDKGSETEHIVEFINHVILHYNAHFYLFKEATENALQDFKAGLIVTQTSPPALQGHNTRIKTNLTVPELALLFKLLSEVKPDVFLLESKEELFRFISANFATKKSSEEGISTDKLRILFSQPDPKAIALWEQHFRTCIAEIKKIKEKISS